MYVDARACHELAPPGSGLLSERNDRPDWCRRTSSGWERIDGLGFAVIADDRIVAVHSPVGDELQVLGLQEPAGADDIAALAGTLRPMTLVELERYLSRAHP